MQFEALLFSCTCPRVPALFSSGLAKYSLHQKGISSQLRATTRGGVGRTDSSMARAMVRTVVEVNPGISMLECIAGWEMGACHCLVPSALHDSAT